MEFRGDPSSDKRRIPDNDRRFAPIRGFVDHRFIDDRPLRGGVRGNRSQRRSRHGYHDEYLFGFGAHTVRFGRLRPRERRLYGYELRFCGNVEERTPIRIVYGRRSCGGSRKKRYFDGRILSGQRYHRIGRRVQRKHYNAYAGVLRIRTSHDHADRPRIRLRYRKQRHLRRQPAEPELCADGRNERGRDRNVQYRIRNGADGRRGIYGDAELDQHEYSVKLSRRRRFERLESQDHSDQLGGSRLQLRAGIRADDGIYGYVAPGLYQRRRGRRADLQRQDRI